MPETAKDTPYCNGCEFQTLPNSSGFCYMFAEMPKPCMQHSKFKSKNPRKNSPLLTAMLIATLFGGKK